MRERKMYLHTGTIPAVLDTRCDMRKIVFRVVLTAFLAVSLLLSCNHPSDPGSDGLGDGQGISFVIETDRYVFTDNLSSGYKPADDETCVIASDEVGTSAANAIHIYFPGNTAGTFTDPPDPGTGLPQIGVLLNSLEYYTWEEGCWFSIEVSSYGPVGGRIEGTFSGELIDGSEKKEIKDGIFSVTRYN